MTKPPAFRVGQRVMHVDWKSGQPFIRFRTVTKITKTTLYVDNLLAKCTWYADAKSAIEAEYKELVQMWDLIFSRGKPADWTMEDTVICICRVRRMERRLLRRATNKEA